VIEACVPGHRPWAAGDPQRGSRSPNLGARGSGLGLSGIQRSGDRASSACRRAFEALDPGHASLQVRRSQLAGSETQACKPGLGDDRLRIGTITARVSGAMGTRPDRDRISIARLRRPGRQRCRFTGQRSPVRGAFAECRAEAGAASAIQSSTGGHHRRARVHRAGADRERVVERTRHAPHRA
jgi:hypothetical protein